MKKLNNAMNDISDKYIEEAATATHIQNKSGRLVRNIAVSAAGVAAAAGICIGLGNAGVFGGGHKGIDLLPASSVPSEVEPDTTTSATTVGKSDIELPVVEFADSIPLVNFTEESVMEIFFGSEFPEMLYADNAKAIFTDGINGLYVFDFAEDELVSAVDITRTIELGLPELPAVSRELPGWDGIELFAASDGTPYCAVSYSPVVSTGSGLPLQQTLRTEHYCIDTDKMLLTHIESAEAESLEKYGGLFELPFDGAYHNMSLLGARIEGTDEYVYIRNCTADIDLFPIFDLQYIELRRAADGDKIEECMEGGYFPFDDISLPTHNLAMGADYEGGNDNGDLYGLHLDKKTFLFEAKCKCPLESLQGGVEVFGDIVKLTEQESGYVWLYRISGDELLPLVTDQNAELSEVEQLDKLSGITMKKLQDSVSDNADDHAELCDMIREANEPLKILENYIGYHIGTEEHRENIAMGDMFVNADNVHLMSNLFLSEEETVNDVSVKTGTYLIETSVVSDDPNAACFKTYYINAETNLVTSVIEYNSSMEIIRVSKIMYTLRCLLDEEQEQYADEMAVQQAESVYTAAQIIAELQAGQEKYGAYDAKTADIKLQWPLYDEYRIIANQYGEYRGHNGIDITGENIFGADIMAAADGRVIAANSDRNDEMGCWLAIDHGNGIVSVYAHCESISATEGMEVAAGSVIASVGSTGLLTGSHLHFAVLRNFSFVDPFEYGFV